jgi:SAM-dependent methyltransferase
MSNATLLEQQMAQMLAAREAVGNYQPPKGDWRSASVQELIAQERQRSLLWRPQRFWVGARSTFGEDRAQRGSMSRTPRRYDAEQVRRFSDTTIAYYDQFARAFWNGTRHHDVSQNYAAFLDAIEGDPPYSILDLGCGPGRDLIHFRSLGHEAVGLDGSQQFVAMARSHSQCEVLHQDFLAMQLPESRFDGIFANASLFHVPSQELQRVLLELFQTLKPRGVLFSSNPRGNNEEGFTDDRYACFFDLDTWRDYVTSAGFEEVGHYYRPPGLPRHKQPWLATVWRKA